MATTRTQSIPVPEPGLTQEEVVQRARDMIPTLRERHEECERIGRLLDETSRDFVEAGFYGLLPHGFEAGAGPPPAPVR